MRVVQVELLREPPSDDRVVVILEDAPALRIGAVLTLETDPTAWTVRSVFRCRKGRLRTPDSRWCVR